MITRNRLGLVSLCALGFAVACGGKDVLDLGGGSSADLGGGSPDGGPSLDGGNGNGSSSGGSSSGGSSSGGSSSGGNKSTATAWLAFDSNSSGTRSIYFIQANGANVVRSTTTSANESEPAFSPDGTKMAFTSDASGAPQIYIRDLVAKTSKVLSSRPYGAHQPTWSPDGSLIAFVGLPEASEQDAGVNPPTGIADIYVIAPDGTGEKDVMGVVPANVQYAWYPAYYPATPIFAADSKSIVFVEEETIYAVNIDGTGLRTIAGWPTEGTETPSVSPDGTHVAFASWTGYGEGLLTTDYAGPADNGRLTLAQGTQAVAYRRPSWSATNVLAVEAVPLPGSGASIRIVSALGGTPPALLSDGGLAPITPPGDVTAGTPVTSDTADNRNPTWAPAGFVSP